MPSDKVLTLADISSDLEGKAIEGFLSQVDRDTIKKEIGVAKLKKGHISLFFGELLARDEAAALSNEFADRVKKFHYRISAAFG